MTQLFQFARRFTGLFPLVIVASLFVAPLVIWLVKDDGPAIVTDRLTGRIVSVGQFVEKERRVVVQLEDGLTVVIRSTRVPQEAKAGDKIDVLRSKQPTGEIDYEVDG